MYLDHITIFLNLSETLNFSKTALNMHLSQSSVSQAISSIERELGMKLFIRDRKSVKLTASGLDLYNSLKPWLNNYYKAVQHAQNVETEEQTNLTIGYSGTPFETAMIPILVKKFCHQYPKVKVFFENYAHSVLIDHLKSGNCDIIFTMPDIIKGIEDLAYFNLVDGHYCLVIPQDYQQSFSNPVNVSALGEQNAIFLDHRWCPPSQNKLQHELLANNQHLHLSYVNNIVTAHAMVKAGAGLGVWADFVQDPTDTDLTCYQLNTSILPKYGIATLKHTQNQAAKLFVKWMQVRIAEMF